MPILNADRAGRTDLDTPPARDARLGVDAGARAMLLPLSPGCRASHGEILERASEPRHLMPLEVAQNDHAVGAPDRAGDERGCKMPETDGDDAFVLPSETVGDDDRRSGRRIPETMENRRRRMIRGVRAHSRVQRIRVGQERVRPAIPDPVDDAPDEDRIDEAVIPAFAEVELDGREVVLPEKRRESRRVEERRDLGACAPFPAVCLHRGVEDRTQ